jgi:hypothetical protein
MREKRSLIWLFLIAYGVVLVLFFSTEQLEDHKIKVRTLNYNVTSKGVDLDTLFDKDALANILSNVFRSTDIRLLGNREDIVYRFLEDEIKEGNHFDPAEPSLTITAFYNGYTNFFKSDQVLSGGLIQPELDDKTLENMIALTENDHQHGQYDVYGIDQYIAYNPMLSYHIFMDMDLEYTVMFNHNMVFVDLDQDQILDYAYHMVGDVFEQILIVELDRFEQRIYEACLALDDTTLMYDLEYDEEQIVVVKQEEK